ISLGCNPATLPNCAAALALVTVSDNCDNNLTAQCAAGTVQTNNCQRTQSFTLTATDTCGNPADPCVVTYTWTVDTTAPTFTGCPASSINLGCNPTRPTCATVAGLGI